MTNPRRHYHQHQIVIIFLPLLLLLLIKNSNNMTTSSYDKGKERKITQTKTTKKPCTAEPARAASRLRGADPLMENTVGVTIFPDDNSCRAAATISAGDARPATYEVTTNEKAIKT